MNRTTRPATRTSRPSQHRSRRRPSHIVCGGDYGQLWIDARLRDAEGDVIHHSWAVTGPTGWVRADSR